MYSGKVELGDLPPCNEINDENVSCIKLTELKENDHCYLNSFKGEAVNAEASNDPEKFQSSIISYDISHALSGFYAQLLVVVTSVAIFSELLHEHLTLFYIQDYLFIYLLGIGTLLLVGAFANKLYERFFRVNIRDLVKMPQYLSKKLVGEVNKSYYDQYFKIGVFMFGLGVLISNGLEINAIFLSPVACLYMTSVSQIILRFIFNALQMAFFVLSSKEVWHIFGGIKNLAFMHLLAVNLTLFIRLLFWESAKDWEAVSHVKHNSSLRGDKIKFNLSIHALESDLYSSNSLNHAVYYTNVCWWRVQKSDEMDVTSVQVCLENSTIGAVWSKATELLYPIMAQYYFVILCILFVLWVNGNSKQITNYCFTSAKKNISDTVCSRSTKGLFLGAIILFVSLLFVILFFTVSSDLKLVVRTLFCIIFGSSSFSCFLGIMQSRKMQNREFVDTYDGLIRNCGLLVVYIYSSCNVIAGVTTDDELSYVLAIEAVFMIVHATAQNLFVALVSRKKIDQSNWDQKPARQSVMFLMLCNISLWTLECFISWNSVKRDIQLFTFGRIVWPLLTRLIFPCLTFYRFQSAVQLYKVWKNSYS